MSTLVYKPTSNSMFCFTHQQEWTLHQLALIIEGSKGRRECPLCADALPAEFAREIEEKKQENALICYVHTGKGCDPRPATGHCNTCGLDFCSECMAYGGLCVFCKDYPYSGS